jgi:pSer/pThr/pTyr-binding forkhead associated (FHA) protein
MHMTRNFQRLPALLLTAFLLFLSVVIAPLSGTAARQTETPVLEASHSVYRVLVCLKLPESDSAEIMNKLPSDVRAKGWAGVDGKALLIYEGKCYFFLGHGSTYLVSPNGHWVTNEHVVTPPENLPPGAETALFVLYSLSPKLEMKPIQVLWQDSKKDLAILKAEPPAGAKPLTFANQQFIHQAQRVMSIGFPGLADDLSRGGGFGDVTSFVSPKMAEGLLSHSYISTDNTQMWQHSCNIVGGNSGGPLVNECGQVVGTNDGGIAFGLNPNVTIATGYNHAISLQELLPRLDALHVSYRVASTACDSSVAGLPRWFFPVLAGVILLVVVLAGALLYFALKHNRQAGRNIPITHSMFEVLKNLAKKKKGPVIADDGIKWYWDDINGKWYYFDEFGNHITGDGPNPVPHPDPKPSGPEVVLRSRHYPDIVIKDGQSLIIGSAKDKSDVFIQARYISKAHCRVSNHGGMVTVEDLNSTNGTFINGHRISNPTPLRAGDTLDLTPEHGDVAYGLGQAPKLGPEVVLRSRHYPDILIRDGQSLIIGSSKDKSDVVVQAKYVSKAHCRVRNDGGMATVEDLNSTNGTFVNGRRITSSVPLRKGDVLDLTPEQGEVSYGLGEAPNRGGGAVAVLRPLFTGVNPVPLRLGQSLSIGRAEDNTIVLSDQKVSSHHCVIVMKSADGQGLAILEDKGSLNGTFMGGDNRRIDSVILNSGDQFYIVEPTYTFQLDVVSQ